MVTTVVTGRELESSIRHCSNRVDVAAKRFKDEVDWWISCITIDPRSPSAFTLTTVATGRELESSIKHCSNRVDVAAK
jgi:hypothetical protein